MDTLLSKWEEFEKIILPKNAGIVQRKDIKTAFYAGALQILYLQSQLVIDGESQKEWVRMMGIWLKEITSVADQL